MYYLSGEIIEESLTDNQNFNSGILAMAMV